MKKNKFYPLVSVIMNCYNGEKYLEDSIQSVISQTYDNWELIFWDNRSEDSSSEIFKKYQDKRFKYFYASKHTSLYEARNLAIQKSTGEFISFLDTDDLWDKEKLEKQMDYFDDHSIGVVYSNYWLVKKDLRKKKISFKKKLYRGHVYNELMKNYNIGILTAIIRKKNYEELKKKFDERFSIIGDFDLFLRLSKLCKFESIQAPLAYYRLHRKNLSTINKEKEIEELNIWLRENEATLNQFNVKRIKKKIYHRKFVNCKIEGNYKECLNILLNSGLNLLNLKNLIIFLLPAAILKKLLWYHQD
tara:strand:- start:113 stop:1021 length:909 start_codon:yes stop_codon:yes gene_type:complete